MWATHSWSNATECTMWLALIGPKRTFYLLKRWGISRPLIVMISIRRPRNVSCIPIFLGKRDLKNYNMFDSNLWDLMQQKIAIWLVKILKRVASTLLKTRWSSSPQIGVLELVQPIKASTGHQVATHASLYFIPSWDKCFLKSRINRGPT